MLQKFNALCIVCWKAASLNKNYISVESPRTGIPKSGQPLEPPSRKNDIFWVLQDKLDTVS